MTITPEIEAKWRAEFEQLTINGCVLADLKAKPCGEYFNHHTESQWQGFLMGRSTVEFSLPEKVSVGFGTNRSFAYIEIEPLIEAIESQGYRVKGES
jgi:hypothetical protein